MSGTTAVILALSACASSSTVGTDETTTSASHQASIELPDEYQGRRLAATVLSNYAPLGFLDEDGELDGLDKDFAEAIGQKIGVEVEAIPNAWENGLLGIEGGKYDWTGSAAITAERLEKFDMTSYFTTGDALVVLADSPELSDEMTDLCGLSIGSLTGDRLIDELEKGSAECQAAGEPAIDVQSYPSISDAQLATKSGNLDGWFTGKIYAAYSEQLEPGVWKVTGPQPRSRVVDGFITRKGSGMAEVLAQAVNELIEDGTYQAILAKWGIGGQALEVSEVNPTEDVIE
ncbi:hypothetical protein BCD48_05910 [Pseudofrankia sp. BMG5.36]|nr:hypothetical protein BCD48_05910 [Pseudofrankia sp. BMG5.36]